MGPPSLFGLKWLEKVVRIWAASLRWALEEGVHLPIWLASSWWTKALNGPGLRAQRGPRHADEGDAEDGLCAEGGGGCWTRSRLLRLGTMKLLGDRSGPDQQGERAGGRFVGVGDGDGRRPHHDRSLVGCKANRGLRREECEKALGGSRS